ncbi:MAG: hypothetical protein ACOY71_08985 [Gemmatimonadota bacterium]
MIDPRLRRRLGVLACGATLLLDAACTEWRTTNVTPQELVSQDREPVRITQEGEIQLVLYNLTLKADTLVGYLSPTAIGTTQVPLSYIRQYEIKRFSVTRTLGLAAILGGSLFAIDRLQSGPSGF